MKQKLIQPFFLACLIVNAISPSYGSKGQSEEEKRGISIKYSRPSVGTSHDEKETYKTTSSSPYLNVEIFGLPGWAFLRLMKLMKHA